MIDRNKALRSMCSGRTAGQRRQLHARIGAELPFRAVEGRRSIAERLETSQREIVGRDLRHLSGRSSAGMP
jgi:hypothetical protein